MTEHPTPPRQDEEPPVRRWPGAGWCEPGDTVRYGGVVWRCIRPGAGKPPDRSTQWIRVSERSED